MNAQMIHALPTLLLGFLIKSTLLLLAAWAIDGLLRRNSAATRHLVWSVALGGVLMLPILSLSLPRWNIAYSHALAPPAPNAVPQAPSLPSAPTNAPTVSQAVPPSASISDASRSFPTATVVSRAIPMRPSGHQFTTFTILLGVSLLVWLVGLLYVLGQLAVGLSRLARIERHSIPLKHRELRLTEDFRGVIGQRRPVRFLRSTEGILIAVPVTWGVLRPVVLLPAQSNAWSEDCLRAVLLHEIAHVSRWDWATQITARLACALYWWHPLVWWAARRAREESERACDDLVLGTGMKAADYAQRLVEVVRSMPQGVGPRTVAIAMAQPSEVEGRLQAVLAKGRNRSRLSRRALVVTLALVSLLVLPLTVLRPIAHGATGSSPSNQSAVPAERRMSRGILEFVYLKNLATDTSPGRHLRLVVDRGTDGHSSYELADIKTNQTSRDPKAVQAALQAILAQGYQQRAGSTSYLIPLELAINVPTREVFFTSDQRRQVDGLEREKKAFLGLLADSPVIATDADVESAVARLTRTVPPTFSVDMNFTPDGARRMGAFTASHKGELMGVLVDGGLVMAPLIQDEVGKGVISVGFRDMNEAQALATRLNAPAGTEVIGGGIHRATYPDGTVYEADEDAGQQASVAPGYSATLPNGCTVDVVGVMQAARKGDNWVFGGPVWAADGKRAPDLRQSDSGWSWPLYVTAGLTPCWVDLNISPPRGQLATEPLSTYFQLSGVASKPWSRTFQRWGDRVGPFASEDGGPCSLRVGVAAGPWQTAATLPVHLNQQDLRVPASGSPFPLEIKLDDRPALMYQDGEGHRHTDYFLPAGQRLGNVARRVVAVEVSGQTVAGSDWNSHPLAVSDGRTSDVYPVATGLFDISFYGPLVSNVATVKEYRLETRPYQVVEFRNIQVKPRIVNGETTAPAVDFAWREKEQKSLSNMRRIGLLIQEYIQDNDGRLPSLGTVPLLERDLAFYQRQQEKFPDPQTGHRYAVRGRFLFVNPMTGRPYRPAAVLSKNLISRIARPAYTVLLSDGPTVIPEETIRSRWVLEAFADEHVSGRAGP